MQYFIFIIKTAFFDFSRNKARTILTSLGILIGVLAVVLLLAFGLGLKKFIENQFESLGTNNLRIVPGRPFQSGGFRGPASFGTIRFDEKDIVSLKKIQEIKYIVPIFSKTVDAKYAGQTKSSDFYATTADIFNALNLDLDRGRLFTNSDVVKRNKIVVLGSKTANNLFGDAQTAVGKLIKFEGASFRVVGVLKSKGVGGFGGPDIDAFIYIPYKTGFTFNPDKKFLAIITTVRNKNEINAAKSKILSRLSKRYDIDDFSVLEPTDILNAIGSIFSVMNAILVAIAAISLVVGGIGIMNIMYVTVTERIKEIGIRRAMGARKSDILFLFLAESVILSLLGGLAGLFLAYLIVLLIQRVFPAYINIQTVLLATGVSSIIGIVFGVFPAKKAADLSPIEAIRYE